ncbi:MAG: hypothetical protein KAG61_03950, partial [Bacteriovoracaceae bacterium]|nr:hypothetical protein [Bacteriovoracaceae bacterium]
YAQGKATTIYNYAKNSMQAEQVRFMTMVPRKNAVVCSSVGHKQPAHGYAAASAKIHALTGSPLQYACTDKSIPCMPDSYDICSSSYEGIFNGIDDSIQDTLIKNTYRYWPIIKANETTPPPFDPSKVQITKIGQGGEIVELEEGRDWKYVGYRSNQWTRETPSKGEPMTGYFVELTDSGKVEYPACLVVETQNLADCYQYIQLQSKPYTSSITLKINGININESNIDGWKDVGYLPKQDIKMQCPGSSYGHTPENKTGHFLKLNGSATYGNNAVIELSYEPDSSPPTEE